jgi:mono/diheme cytochrome c family protein
VIAIVKNGLEGRVTVNNAAYSGIMPSWKGQIPDDQIAAVISYIRSSWTNHAGGVSLAQVRSVK